MNFPVDDWQFWVATVITIGGVYMLLRSVVFPPRGKNDSGKSCGGCAAGSAASVKKRG